MRVHSEAEDGFSIPTEPDDAAVLVSRAAIQRLVLAADSYGVKHLDSDDMDDAAEELQAATEAVKDLIFARAK